VPVPLKMLRTLALLAASSALAGSPVSGQPEMLGKSVRSCGRVLAANCSGPGSVSLALELQPGVVVTISTEKVADQAAAQLAAARLLDRRVCATGTLTHTNEPFQGAVMAIDELDALVPQDVHVEVTPFAPGAHEMCARDVQAPVLEREVPPNYTAAALGAKIQGAVWVQVLISPKGRVQKARVIRSIDPQLGLDREALTAARRGAFALRQRTASRLR
jgi:TonB family protein